MHEYDIKPIAEKLGLKEEQLIAYGREKAKIELKTIPENLPRKGKLILCTAITPTKAGEGKTTTAISLADGLALLKKNALESIISLMMHLIILQKRNISIVSHSVHIVIGKSF